MRKRVLNILLMLVMAFGFVACGNASPSEDATGTTVGEISTERVSFHDMTFEKPTTWTAGSSTDENTINYYTDDVNMVQFTRAPDVVVYQGGELERRALDGFMDGLLENEASDAKNSLQKSVMENDYGVTGYEFSFEVANDEGGNDYF